MRQANVYDALKCVALVAMTVDHLGFFFVQHEDWLRIIGRIVVPLFLFLVGYNGSFRFRTSLCVAAILVTLADGLVQHLWWPQNILWTILVVRLVLHYTLARFRHSEIAMAAVVAIPFTLPVLDGGSFAFLFAVIGYRLRHGRDRFALGWLAFALLLWGAYSYAMLLLHPSLLEGLGLAALLSGTGVALAMLDLQRPLGFLPRTFSWVASVSLYYYVVHKTLFELVAHGLKLGV